MKSTAGILNEPDKDEKSVNLKKTTIQIMHMQGVIKSIAC